MQKCTDPMTEEAQYIQECTDTMTEWQKQFGEFTASNLTTWNVLGSPDMSYVFVDINHPAVHLLRNNKEIVGIDVDEQPLIDGHYVKMTKLLFESCCSTIRAKVMTWT